MTGHLEECPGEGFSGSTSQRRVVAALRLFFLDRANESPRHLSLGGGLDQGVAILQRLAGVLFKFCDAPFQAGEDLFGFFADVGKLTVREIWHVSNEHLAVVAQRQKGWSWPLPVTRGAVMT